MPRLSPPAADSEAVANRYAGGKLVLTETVVAGGETTILTPPAGQSIRLFWVSAMADPDEANSPLIRVLLGGDEIYRAYVIAQWEIFTGDLNAALKVDLSSPASVAVTAHYEIV